MKNIDTRINEIIKYKFIMIKGKSYFIEYIINIINIGISNRGYLSLKKCLEVILY